jgi:hypothetical protein
MIILNLNMSKSVKKFNNLICMFISDLSSTVPDSQCLVSANEWVGALYSLDPLNDKVLQTFMKALQGANDFISRKDATVFKHLEFMPSVLKPEELWLIFTSLSESDKQVCWKYISKLYKVGIEACKDLGIVFDPSASIEAGNAALQLLLKQTPNADQLTSMQVPDGPIVLHALGALCTQYCDLVEQWGVLSPEKLSELRSKTPDDFSSEIAQRYPGDASQMFLTDAGSIIDLYGCPFIDEPLGDCPLREDILGSLMQMGTISMTLQSVDSNTISAVENVARSFMQKLQTGEIDLDGVADDPFALLQKLASTGLADDLMNMLGGL